MKWMLVVLFLTLLAPACRHTEEAGREADVGRTVFEGVAANAKLGAMVHNDTGMVYCIEMQEWPEGVVGKRVKVTGVMEKTDRFKATVADDGAVSQGTSGSDTVLRNVQWELVE